MATQPLPEEPELVTVFETEDEPELSVVQSLLRSEGNIESVVTGIDAPPDVLPGVGGIMIRVPVSARPKLVPSFANTAPLATPPPAPMRKIPATRLRSNSVEYSS